MLTFRCAAQCNTPETKIMVLGDSWAFFSWTNNSYNENLDRFGFTDIRANSSIDISINGARAENYFSDPDRKQKIADFLAANPEIEYCHISLGGNDVLGEWNKNMTTPQLDSLLGVIVYNLRRDIDTVLSLKPDLKFIISGYDYPNFVETAALSSLHPYYGQWTDMGQPDALEINTALARLTQSYTDSAAVWSNVYFVNNNGLMQWTYGQTTPLIIPPYATYPAHYVPLPGGDLNYPSPRTAMALSGTDSFHLGDDSFECFIKRHFEEFYWVSLRDFDASIGAADTSLNGNITSTSTNSASIKTGKVDIDEVQGIITFNTSLLNQALDIESASIFLNRQNLSGGNLASQDLTIEIKSGYFGANLQLENDDYISSGDASAIACTYGTVEKNDYWIRIDLPGSMLPFINKTGYTQFKLKYSGAGTNNYFEFKNSGDSINQPFLDVNYDFSTSENEIIPQADILIYPNPAEEQINFSLPGSKYKRIISAELINCTGKTVFKGDYVSSKGSISAAGLPSGIYYLVITEGNKRESSKIIISN